MKTKFIYKKELESDRLLITLHSIGKKYYQKNGFFVLPYKVNKFPKSVYLPHIKK